MSVSRVHEIDLLRFVAALSVVFFHYAFRGHAAGGLSEMPYPWLAPVAQYGYYGVELFFLISGFVILMTASNESLRHFIISRIVRLYPAFWVCCTLTALACVLLGGTLFTVSWKQYLANLSLMGDFIGARPIDGSYWSLFVEIRFYALIALILLCRQMRNIEAWLLGWLGVSIVLEISPIGFLREWLITDFSSFFIAGALCFLIYAKKLSLSRLCGLIFSLALSIQQALKEAVHFEKIYSTPYNSAIVISIITGCYLTLFLVCLRRTGPLQNKPWIMLGALTYPLYLIHQNLGYMLINVLYPAINSHLIFWGICVLMLAIAWLVNRLIERRYAKPFSALLNKGFSTLPFTDPNGHLKKESASKPD